MRKKSGFSLFEILLITAFFAIAIYVCRPFYYRWTVRSKQVQALAKLSNIFKIQQIYYTTNETYIKDMDSLKVNGFEVKEGDLYDFELEAEAHSASGYKATATSKKNFAPCSNFSRDIWTMNEKKDFTNSTNGALGCM